MIIDLYKLNIKKFKFTNGETKILPILLVREGNSVK